MDKFYIHTYRQIQIQIQFDSYVCMQLLSVRGQWELRVCQEPINTEILKFNFVLYSEGGLIKNPYRPNSYQCCSQIPPLCITNVTECDNANLLTVMYLCVCVCRYKEINKHLIRSQFSVFSNLLFSCVLSQPPCSIELC